MIYYDYYINIKGVVFYEKNSYCLRIQGNTADAESN